MKRSLILFLNCFDYFRLSEKRKPNNENENVAFYVLYPAKDPKLRPIRRAAQFCHVSHSLQTEMRISEDK